MKTTSCFAKKLKTPIGISPEYQVYQAPKYKLSKNVRKASIAKIINKSFNNLLWGSKDFIFLK